MIKKTIRNVYTFGYYNAVRPPTRLNNCLIMVLDLTWVRLSNITNKKLIIFNNKTTFVFYLNIAVNGTCRSDEPSAETSSQKKP